MPDSNIILTRCICECLKWTRFRCTKSNRRQSFIKTIAEPLRVEVHSHPCSFCKVPDLFNTTDFKGISILSGCKHSNKWDSVEDGEDHSFIHSFIHLGLLWCPNTLIWCPSHSKAMSPGCVRITKSPIQNCIPRPQNTLLHATWKKTQQQNRIIRLISKL